MQTEKNQSWRSCMSNSYIISGSLNWKEHTVKNNYVLRLEGHFMGPTGTQGQMLCGVHLPHSLRASKQYLGSFINIIDVAISIRCQKWFGGILWTSDNEKVMTDPGCTVQDYQTFFSVQPIQKTDNCIWGPQMTLCVQSGFKYFG